MAKRIKVVNHLTLKYPRLFGWAQCNQLRWQWQSTPVLLPEKSHGWRSLVGCGPWGRYELGTTEQFHFHYSLSCCGEGNGNPLRCSCLENPRDGGAWWASVYGVAQGWTRLKWLSSSSSSSSSSIDILPFWLTFYYLSFYYFIMSFYIRILLKHSMHLLSVLLFLIALLFSIV